jgi:hypothetical protein
VMASSSHLKPGERGSVTATVDTRNRAGSIVKAVEVVSNDPAMPKVILRLKADVKPKDNPASPQQTPDKK